MGKALLIIALGVSVIVSFFILKLNSNSKENLSTTVNMFEETQARLISNSGVEVYLERLKHDRTMINRKFLDNELFGGRYDITIVGPESLVTVTSTATFMDAQHTTVVEAAADRVPFIPGPGAMYLSATTIAALKKNAISGNIEINGYDHDLDGNQIAGTPKPGIGVDGETQRLAIIDMINEAKINNIVGAGGKPSVMVVNDTTDWSEYAQLLADNPDYLINAQDQIKYINSWGTLSEPKVTFINGDITLNNSQSASGCGILVINGNLTINGDFNYKGLLVSFKSATVQIKLSGNVEILGSLVAAGNEIDVDVSAGNFRSLYSTEALAKIQDLLVTKRFSILTWWE